MELSESRPASWLLRALLLGAGLAAGWVLLTVVLGVAAQSAHAEGASPGDIPTASSAPSTASTAPSTQPDGSSVARIATSTSNDLASTASVATSSLPGTVAPLLTATTSSVTDLAGAGPSVDTSHTDLVDTASSVGSSDTGALDAGSAVGSTVDALEGVVSTSVASAADVVSDPVGPLLHVVLGAARPVADGADVTQAVADTATSPVPMARASRSRASTGTMVRAASPTSSRLLDPFGTPSNTTSGCLGAGIGFAGTGAAGGGASATSPNALVHGALTSAAARPRLGDRLPPAPPGSPEVSPD